MTWLFVFLSSWAFAKGNLSKIESCVLPAAQAGAVVSTKKVMLIKQWHLAPTTITKSFKEKYPQEKNQTAIYQALNDLVKKKKLDLVVAEGCEGEMNSEFKTAFNGWDLESLKKQSQTKGYDRVLTHVALKLEARHGDKLLTVCGDSNGLVAEGTLRLSNLRGWVGFWGKLNDASADEDKLKLYGEAAADLLKVPKETSRDQILLKVKEKIKEELDAFSKTLLERNTAFVKALEGREFKTAAIVVGGLHAGDLKAKLGASGYACDVYEPAGYVKQDEDLIAAFQKALQ